ncbi:ArnT family glycosyltransferase [Clostridium pasteurianum]|uniref:ArnT family glycosyltransferase n=1 Tax=Clostridium pasteurianum TaxID=1501 RepID=UPI003D6D72CF
MKILFSLRDEKKRTKYGLLIIEIIFIMAALISIFKYGNSLLLGSLEKFDNDDVKYIRSAWNLIDNKILSYENVKESTLYIMPGLTFVLAFFMMIFGKMQGLVAFKVFQMMLQAGSIYLIFLIGRKVFGSRVGLIASVIDVIYITELFVVNTILMECISKFLLLLLIYISIYAIETKSVKLYALGGIIWAISCLFKPTMVVYPILILVIWIKSKYKFSEILKYTTLVLIIFCTIMSPWWVRNYIDFNRFIPFTKSTGNPFLQGTFINYDQSEGWGVPYVKGRNAIESDENETKAGLQRLEKYGKKQPFKFVFWYTIGKTLLFWKDPFYWRTIFNITFLIANVIHKIILLLGIIGMVKGAKENSNVALLIGVLLFLNLIYLPFYTFSRYSYIAMPLVMIFAAFSIDKIIIRKKRNLLVWKRTPC